MEAAVLSIGTELTRGELVNTNAAWLAARLTELGFDVTSCDTVDDERGRIVGALERLGRSHHVVVCTGGLGPTSDDMTSECAARAAGVGLVRDVATLDAIRRRFDRLGRVMSPLNAKQADLPEGAEILANPVGTAPAFALRLGGGNCLAFFMPGVPREMQRLWADYLVPRLRPLAPDNTYQVRLKTFGLPESTVAERLGGLEEANPGLTIGYRASYPEIEVKVHVRAGSRDQARGRAQALADEVRQRLGDVVYGEGDDTFPEAVGRAVHQRGWWLALAESCTGGLVGTMLTDRSASEFLLGGAVTYANSAKTRLVGVSEDVLRAHGAVSGECAASMAEGVRRALGADVALAITGIAGPTGGTPEKPLGLVYWSVAHAGGTVVRDRVLTGDREQIRRMAAFIGLALVRDVCRGRALALRVRRAYLQAGGALVLGATL